MFELSHGSRATRSSAMNTRLGRRAGRDVGVGQLRLRAVHRRLEPAVDADFDQPHQRGDVVGHARDEFLQRGGGRAGQSCSRDRGIGGELHDAEAGLGRVFRNRPAELRPLLAPRRDPARAAGARSPALRRPIARRAAACRRPSAADPDRRPPSRPSGTRAAVARSPRGDERRAPAPPSARCRRVAAPPRSEASSSASSGCPCASNAAATIRNCSTRRRAFAGARESPAAR